MGTGSNLTVKMEIAHFDLTVSKKYFKMVLCKNERLAK